MLHPTLETGAACGDTSGWESGSASALAGAKIIGVSFASRDAALKTATTDLAAAHFTVVLPPGANTTIIQTGILDCEPDLPTCDFALVPAPNAQLPGADSAP